jgi:uncharacterized sulfatase
MNDSNTNNSQQRTQTSPTPPNIVFIMADDLGWADLPVYGNTFNEALNLTRLAAQGMRFTDAYAAAPVCSPTRASFLSGQAPPRTGIIDWIPGHWRPFEKLTGPVNRPQFLRPEIPTLANALRDAGYATGLFGKWHVGHGAENHALTRGFDEANVGQGYFDVRFDPPRDDSAEKIMAERLTDFSIDFIERHKSRPLFLFLSHWDVHCLFDAEQPVIDKYLNKPTVPDYPCNAVYAAMIEHMDTSIGRLLDALERLDLEENTVVVCYSDNGGQISNDRYPGVEDPKMRMLMPSKQHVYPEDHPLQYIATSNAPLRGEKGNLYEGGIREPLIVRWPGRVAPGIVSSAPVTTVDFYPTFLELADADSPPNHVLDGISILPELLDGPGTIDPERPLYWHYPVYHHQPPGAAIRKGKWKLVEDFEADRRVLYHLGTDIGETTDLAELYPEKAQELHALLRQWQTDVGAEFPKPNPDFDPARRYEWGLHPSKMRPAET